MKITKIETRIIDVDASAWYKGKPLPKGETDFSAGNRAGRYLRFGVREHAMGAALNGIALSRLLRPYGGTFLIFSDYMRPALRLAAIMEQPTIYVFTHDSIGLGEDGPTHQPIEQLSTLTNGEAFVVTGAADGVIRFELDGKSFVAIDTPGVRKRKSLANDVEYLAILARWNRERLARSSARWR